MIGRSIGELTGHLDRLEINRHGLRPATRERAGQIRGVANDVRDRSRSGRRRRMLVLRLMRVRRAQRKHGAGEEECNLYHRLSSR